MRAIKLGAGQPVRSTCRECGHVDDGLTRVYSLKDLLSLPPRSPRERAIKFFRRAAWWLNHYKDEEGRREIGAECAMSRAIAGLHYLLRYVDARGRSVDAMLEGFAAMPDTDCFDWENPLRHSAKKRKRKQLNASLRWDVFARDDFCCVVCGQKPPGVALHVDHRVPHSRGGSDTLDNLQTLCEDCNCGKGAKC